MITRLKLTADQLRLAVIGGVTILAVGAIGTTAALATSASRASATQGDLAPEGSRLLTIRTSAPPPLLMPGAPAADERLTVLTDAPADLAYDSDLRGSLDSAALRAIDAAETQRSTAETATWEKEAASLQAQINAANHPAYEPVVLETAKPKVDDADVTAAVGDTRATVAAD